MHRHYQAREQELHRGSDRSSSRSSNNRRPRGTEAAARTAAATNRVTNMDNRQSSTPGKQGEIEASGPKSGVQGSRSSHSYDIVGSPQDIQTQSKESGNSKPRRVNTNSSSKDVAVESSFSSHDEQGARGDAEVQRLQSQLRQWQEKTRFVQAESDSLREEIRKQGQAAKAAIESLMLEHGQNQAENEAKIRRLLDGATRDRVDGRWNPPPDQDIRRRLMLLNTDIRDWAKNWATKSLVLDKAVSKETRKYFKDFVHLDQDDNFPLLFRNPASKMKEKIGALLLHAALAHEIHDAFFDGNIFCLKPEDRAVVETVFKDLEQADAKNAYIWRAGLWRLLNPSVSEGSSKVPAILETTRSTVRTYCDSVSTAFQKKPANILFAVIAENGTEAQRRASRLQAILQQASMIATNLWTQHSYFQAADLNTIRSLGIAFDNAIPWLQAHSLNNVDEDSDEANGTEILMVARPGLLAFDADDASGVDGDRYRVLVPATVLLDNK